MASISSDGNGNRTIQFVGTDRKRRSVRLGKLSRKAAEMVKLKVEALNAAAVTGCPLDNEIAGWVAKLGDDLAGKLAAVGLIAPRSSACLGDFIDSYLAGRYTKPNSIRITVTAKRRLVEYFGADRRLETIAPGHADAWHQHLRQRYAPATVGRTVRWAKQFFRAAQRSRFILENPFADLKAPQQTNEARKRFISRGDAEKVVAACPNAEWRVLFALSRYGGLRCPSETLAMTWGDVDWERGRLRVTSPKTSHHEGKGERWIPLFPELRPHLEALFEQAEPGTVYVISDRRNTTNLRTHMRRIIRKAGLTPWEKTFHNLRATRETELAAEYPLHVVCAWMGHSQIIAQQHYLQVQDSDFERAIRSGAESGARAVQNPVQQAGAVIRGDSQESTEGQGNCGFVRGDAELCDIDQYTQQDSNLQPSVP